MVSCELTLGVDRPDQPMAVIKIKKSRIMPFFHAIPLAHPLIYIDII